MVLFVETFDILTREWNTRKGQEQLKHLKLYTYKTRGAQSKICPIIICLVLPVPILEFIKKNL